MTFDQKISIIREELKNPLPGESQQYMMAPEFRGSFTMPSASRNAAVMICLFPGEKDIQLVFIKRNDYDGPHSGQVSFPGGVFENKDRDLLETARRETFEEIGLNCPESGIIGLLTPLLIPVSSMKVQPVVGFIPESPVFSIDKREVNYLIITSLSDLLNPGCIEKETWTLHNMETKVPFYRVNGNIIWGATAMMLSEFLAVISRSGLYQQSQY